MDVFFENAPEIFAEAVKTPQGITALMAVLVAFVAVYLFRNDHGIIKLIALCLLLAGISLYALYGYGTSQGTTLQSHKTADKSIVSHPMPSAKAGAQCNDDNPTLECLWIR